MYIKRQCRCVVWIINQAQQIQCNSRVPLCTNKLVSKRWMNADHRVLRKIYVIWYSFCILVKVLLDPLKLSNFLSLYSLPPRTKTICFWFQTTRNDWVSRNVLERVITILNISVNIIGFLFFQLVSIFEKLHTQFQSLLTEELEIPEQQFNMVYASIYS